ncbi:MULTISPECIES: prealbumin-like fold domain-containing protein [Kribbella]|nr:MULTISPECIES: prealbumin-like fold domain-containing protein [Kribbella]
MRRPLIGAAGLLLVASALIASPALASHPEVSLPGSNFEIDTDANLRVDDAGSLDWANVAETRKADPFTGAADDSFGQGTKEDTAVPTVVDGSIPPNKSDLLTFGVYLEDTATTDFLHLFWHRVQEPSGTTNMDFEFNKSLVTSSNGVTPVRTAGDVLIQYDLSQGGTNPVLFLSRWLTTGPTSACEASNSLPCWSDKVNLSGAGDATGSINTSPIPAAESDGLGPISARTFGEASVDFSALGGGTDPCVSFGSAYLKSRSSDSFTAALKDFIAPTPLNLATCGAIKVTKTRKHAADGPGPHPHAGVAFTVNGVTQTTDANGQTCFDNLQFGSYSVTETLPAGYVADGPLTKTVLVDNVASCAGDPYLGESVSFSNTPLTDLSVSVNSQIDGGTASTIVCTGPGGGTVASGSTGANGDGSASATNLQPGTYTCTIVIDP